MNLSALQVILQEIPSAVLTKTAKVRTESLFMSVFSLLSHKLVLHASTLLYFFTSRL